MVLVVAPKVSGSCEVASMGPVWVVMVTSADSVVTGEAEGLVIRPSGMSGDIVD